MAISTNNESDNNNKNIEEDKLEVEHAIVTFDTYILTPVAVVTKIPTTIILL